MQAKEIFLAAADLPADEREAFLDAECGGDPSLRAEVEGRLEPEVELPEFLEIAPEGDGSESASGMLDRLGDHVGKESRYEILGEFARGGMGAILRVWDRDLRRTLAMKVVLGKGEAATATGDTPAVDEKTLGRFLEEAQVTGQLDHPGIVPVHELGLDAERQVYFTMRLVKGDDLKTVFEQLHGGEGGWTQARVLGVILKVCEAMAYAHSKKVIHRDLKPANIMVGRFGEVYVMDWGLAHVIGQADKKDIRVRPPDSKTLSRVRTDRREAAGADSPLLTMDGDVVGTPAFMSPEQARGEIEAMGPASDVYSVGAILYQLLAGHMPFVPPGTKVNAYAVWALAQQGPPTPVAQIAADASEELVAICEKAMAREPEDRYWDMGELADDLRAYVEGRVVKAHRTGPVVELKKWVSRNKALATALVAAVVLAVGGAGGVGYVRAEGKAAEAEQRLKADAADARADAADAVAELAATVAEREATRSRRLEDAESARELEAQADMLWPAHPEMIPALEAWLERAGELVSHLDDHRAGLAEVPDEPRSTDDQWTHDLLDQLIEDLERLDSEQISEETISETVGWSVARRLAFARELEAGFAEGGEYAQAWAEAIPALKEAYFDLDELTPQMGLVPLGRNPRTLLWEFAHLMSGEVPARNAGGELAFVPETCVVLVLLPGDTVWLGAQADDPEGPVFDPVRTFTKGPAREVTITPFFLSKYEMTQGQWLRLMGINPSFTTDSRALGSDARLHPVETVSWDESVEACRRLGLELPTEAQWEFGARGGTTTPWWTGAERDSLLQPVAANLADQTARRRGAPFGDIAALWPELDDGYPVHAPVYALAANPFGLHHMPGNVWEMCRDGLTDPYAYDLTQTLDPLVESPDAAWHPNRGGSFRTSERYATAALRDTVGNDKGDLSTGFRPSRAIEP